MEKCIGIHFASHMAHSYSFGSLQPPILHKGGIFLKNCNARWLCQEAVLGTVQKTHRCVSRCCLCQTELEYLLELEYQQRDFIVCNLCSKPAVPNLFQSADHPLHSCACVNKRSLSHKCKQGLSLALCKCHAAICACV